MWKLYYAKQTIAMAAQIGLEEAGADYEAVAIDFSNAEQKSPEFLAINPKARVPALVTEKGILTETHAILGYVGRMFPQKNLLPEDPFELAQVESFNLYLASTVHINHAHKMRGNRWSDDKAARDTMRDKVPETMTDSARMIEDTFLKGPWVMGEQFTICDPYLFRVASWMPGDGVDMTPFPKLNAHQAAMKSRNSVQTVLPLHA